VLFLYLNFMQKNRCGWCLGNALYEKYHDQEWGVPIFEDRLLFEFLVLETFQAGLSWITVLKKREYFRKAFDHFDYSKIATYGVHKEDDLLSG
jgi:DNA-3-methyladenine glycosylase I